MQSNYRDVRRHPRFQLTTTANTALWLDNKLTPLHVHNISESGLCVSTERRLPDGETVLVLIAGVELAVQRVWMIPESTDPVKYRFGLMRANTQENLVTLVQSAVGAELMS